MGRQDRAWQWDRVTKESRMGCGAAVHGGRQGIAMEGRPIIITCLDRNVTCFAVRSPRLLVCPDQDLWATLVL